VAVRLFAILDNGDNNNQCCLRLLERPALLLHRLLLVPLRAKCQRPSSHHPLLLQVIVVVLLAGAGAGSGGGGGGGNIDSYLEGRPCLVVLKEKMRSSSTNSMIAVTPSVTHCGSTDDEEEDNNNDDCIDDVSLFQQPQQQKSSSSASSSSSSSLPSAPPPPPPQRGAAVGGGASSLGGAVVSGRHQPQQPLTPQPPLMHKNKRPSLVQRCLTMPSDARRSVSSEFLVNPPPMRLEAWSETSATSFDVRSKSYLQSGIKIKSEVSVFSLLTVDMVKTTSSSGPIFSGLCAHPNERVQRALRREQETGQSVLPPFVFALNLCIPAGANGNGAASSSSNGGFGSGFRSTTTGNADNNGNGVYYHCVAYFGCHDPSVLHDTSTAFGRLASKFFFGNDDQFRNDTFKLIPRVVEGNFIVKKAVGSKPSILGKKLRQYYIQNARYLELVLDIGSDAIAQRIVKLAQGYAKTLHVDMMIVLEGTSEATLPERILGGFRLKNVDFKDLDGKRII
jgi:Protein ENHANCED DISEASE RESISTANCE 2, C-terminal